MTTTLTPDAGTGIERADALQQVNAWIREAQENGDVDEGAIPDYLAELLEHAEADLKTKVERTGLAAIRREQQADAIAVEIKRLQARKQATENEAARIKRYAQMVLDAAGETKVQGTLCTVSLQQNPPSVRGELSAEMLARLGAAGAPFVKIVPANFVLDKRALLERWKGGGELPEGITVERAMSLRVR